MSGGAWIPSKAPAPSSWPSSSAPVKPNVLQPADVLTGLSQPTLGLASEQAHHTGQCASTPTQHTAQGDPFLPGVGIPSGTLPGTDIGLQQRAVLLETANMGLFDSGPGFPEELEGLISDVMAEGSPVLSAAASQLDERISAQVRGPRVTFCQQVYLSKDEKHV